MKFAFLLSMTAFSFAAQAGPIASGGIVRELALCTTSDGARTLTVQENGPRMTAQVLDAERNVLATYNVELYQGIQPVSFARVTYIDSKTKGRAFTLQGPSTNFHNYQGVAKLGRGVAPVKDQNLSCSVFNGVILDQ